MAIGPYNNNKTLFCPKSSSDQSCLCVTDMLWYLERKPNIVHKINNMLYTAMSTQTPDNFADQCLVILPPPCSSYRLSYKL